MKSDITSSLSFFNLVPKYVIQSCFNRSLFLIPFAFIVNKVVFLSRFPNSDYKLLIKLDI